MSLNKLSSNKDLNNMFKAAEALGWVFTKGRKHIRGRHSITGKRVTVSASPSCPFAIQNAKKDLGL